MIDLVEKFFQQDLSEAEAQELEKLLLHSPETASRFNQIAESAYIATGLPHHQWPGKPIHLPPAGGLGTGLKVLLALAAAGAGLVAVRFWPQRPVELPVQTAAPPAQVQPAVKAVLSAPAKPAPLAPKELEGDQLSVLVETAAPSLVTVRILDASGKEVRALWAGVLDPGQKSFRWDGRLSDGNAAPGGDYQIQVQNGPHTLLKKVRIESK
jgi:hypothetical protein